MRNYITGLLTGAVLLALAIRLAAPQLLLNERVSPLGYPETIAKIQSAVTNGGWVISSTMDMQKSLTTHGQTVPRVTLLKICEPRYAAAILNDEKALPVSLMMPCTISIYEKPDGKTYVATMNAGLMGRMFGGTVASVMANAVAPETAEFTAFLNE